VGETLSGGDIVGAYQETWGWPPFEHESIEHEPLTALE